jgi:threonine synthase
VGTCPTCGHTLSAEYDLETARRELRPDAFSRRAPDLWRYFELLPVRDPRHALTLGEGGSPILDLGERAEAPGVRLLVKDDGRLPTGTFKARGMAVAVSRARELGVRSFFVPTAGNAGAALAAYAARARASARVYVPEDTPAAILESCATFGADVVTVPGTIADAGRVAREREKGSGRFDVSTLREPYRVEGKKTMGFEIFEQTRAADVGLPDAVVYPAGGGTGLVGMYKAFRELERLGWVERMPRLIAVQPEGCAPIVRALDAGAPRAEPWADARTIAPGLRVPSPFASERILEAVRESGGCGVTVPDRALVPAMRTLARDFGLAVGPEGAAPFAALPELARRGRIRPAERVLLYNTGSGIGYSPSELERALGG